MNMFSDDTEESIAPDSPNPEIDDNAKVVLEEPSTEDPTSNPRLFRTIESLYDDADTFLTAMFAQVGIRFDFMAVLSITAFMIVTSVLCGWFEQWVAQRSARNRERTQIFPLLENNDRGSVQKSRSIVRSSAKSSTSIGNSISYRVDAPLHRIIENRNVENDDTKLGEQGEENKSRPDSQSSSEDSTDD